MLIFVTVLSLLGSASVLVGSGANLGLALAAPAAAFPRGSSAAMATLAVKYGFPRGDAATSVWFAGDAIVGDRQAFVYTALARTDCLSAFGWAAWTTLDALAGDALYAAAQLAVDAAYCISAPSLPLFSEPRPPRPRRPAPDPGVWEIHKAENTDAAVAIRAALETHASPRLRGWAGAVRAGLPEDVPPDARGVFFATEPALERRALSGTHQRFRPPVTVAPGPAPVQDRSRAFHSRADIYTPEALARTDGWFAAEAADLTALAGGARRRANRGVFLGPSARTSAARGLVIDMRWPPPWYAADLAQKITPRMNAEVFAAMVGGDSYPDQALIAALRDGVVLFEDDGADATTDGPYLQTVLNPSLLSLSGKMEGVAASVAESVADGSLVAHQRPAFSPAHMIPAGAVLKAASADVRRVDDAGAPRGTAPALDSDGRPVLSVNTRSDINGVWLDGSREQPPEEKPNARDAKSDAGVLRRAAEILGEQMYGFSDDFWRFFYQFQVNPRNAWRLNTVFLAPAAAAAAAAGAACNL